MLEGVKFLDDSVQLACKCFSLLERKKIDVVKAAHDIREGNPQILLTEFETTNKADMALKCRIYLVKVKEGQYQFRYMAIVTYEDGTEGINFAANSAIFQLK